MSTTQQTQQTQHNLNIQDYTMREILELYDLPLNPSQTDLQDAKKRMLMMHPDKSRMDPEYFRFYKECYGRIEEYYAMLNKQNQDVNAAGAAKYAPFQHENVEQMRAAIGQGGRANDQFNTLFEKHGVDREKEERNKSRWEWFSRDEPAVAAAATIKKGNGKGVGQEIGQEMEKMRSNVASLVVFKETAPLVLSAGGSSFYDEDEDEFTAGNYVSSDPFSKLRFDDIRRVHKDQTILPVGEKEFAKRTQFASVEDYQKTRTNVGGPMDKTAAERLLREQEAAQNQLWGKRWETTRRRVDQNEVRSREFMSAYLQLK